MVASCSSVDPSPGPTTAPPAIAASSTTTVTTPLSTDSGVVTVPFLDAAGDDVSGPGTFDRTIQIGGAARKYVLHIPDAAWVGDGVRLVLDLHGLGSTPAIHDDLSRFRAKADEKGFVVAQPAAAGAIPTWQAGASPSTDVDFLLAVIADVAGHVALADVFAAGFSNGAGMAHRLACDAPGSVAAIGTVAGAYPDTGPCEAAVAVIAFHGTLDPVVPFGGAGSLLPDVMEWADQWALRSGCDTTEVTQQAADVNRTVWGGCDQGSAVQVYEITSGFHGWPGTKSEGRIINSTMSISATDLMWDFFLTIDRS